MFFYAQQPFARIHNLMCSCETILLLLNEGAYPVKCGDLGVHVSSFLRRHLAIS